QVRLAFAHQGLYVWDTRWRGRNTEVVLEVDLEHELSAVLGGVLAASFVPPPETDWLVSERDGGRRVAISAAATAASRRLLGHEDAHGPLDVHLLLPLIAALKTAADVPA